ncbi:retrotransposon protein, putative, ty1-copia subclass [Tanacetum coccineum]
MEITPLHHGIKISNDLCPKIDEELDRMSRVPYASVVGSIMYAMTCTRPDVSFALSMVRSPSVDPAKSSAVALDGTLCLVNQDRLRPIIVDDLSKWETVGFSVQIEESQESANEEPYSGEYDIKPEVGTTVKPDIYPYPFEEKWIMLAYTTFLDYEIWQMDVKTAFLNEKLTKDVFMAQLEGKCFDMKDLEDAGYILGIKIYRDRSKRLIGLSQDTYLDKILKRFKIENSKKGNLHYIDRHKDLVMDLCPKTNEELDRMSRVPYASAIGSIMYAMTCTRPDVSFALSMVSRHQQNPGEGHWTAVKNILKYLRNTKDRFLVYGGEEELRVTGYCDASWQTDKDDSRSQSGWVFLLNGGAVTWKSSKQDTVADSTCESEYIAACEASKEAIWMKNFIGDLGVVPTVQDPIEIFCDNESAVALTKEPKDHGKSKHIERKYHFVRSKVEEGHVIVKHIRSEDNPADPFTKALAKSRHDEHARSIGLKDNIKF